MRREDRATAPSCPRCGYDLSGQVATWETRCPLTGVCSECGLDLSWTEVMHPERLKVRGFVEHEHGWRVLSSAFRTLWWALLPWRFWTRVRMEHPPRLGRMALWSLSVFLGCHLVFAGMRLASIECMMSTIRTMGRMVPGAAMGRLEWYLNCVLTPLLWYEPSGLRSDLPQVGPFVILVGEWPAFAWGTVVAWIAFPAMVMALPVTRTRAKVRGVHVWRAFGYSGAGLIIFLLPSLVRAIDTTWSICVDNTFATGVARPGPRGSLVLIAIMIGWLAWWWGQAWRRGMRLARPVLHIGVLSIVAGMGALVSAGIADSDVLLLMWP
ncbi:MAG: hypothetical protein H6811_08525 [Phycisphaeraceae bacterium]|nr:hypothetical protein [Phycisphaeraceae bacterium]